MPASDSSEEWHHLTDLYSELGDEELLELRAAYEDLTEVAQNVLRDELRRRKLSADEGAPRATLRAASSQPDLNYEEIADLLQKGGVSVCECETSQEAELYCYVLELAKIKGVVLRRGEKFDLRLPQVRVAPDDAERAKALLSQPIPDATRKDFEEQFISGDFEIPACKRCGSADVLLEAVEPTNQWRCDKCGARWQDPPPAE
ncbi:MAG: hypothetical protein ACR2JE_01590 [Acidobacteriaceae bacterium]